MNQNRPPIFRLLNYSGDGPYRCSSTSEFKHHQSQPLLGWVWFGLGILIFLSILLVRVGLLYCIVPQLKSGSSLYFSTLLSSPPKKAKLHLAATFLFSKGHFHFPCGLFCFCFSLEGSGISNLSRWKIFIHKYLQF